MMVSEIEYHFPLTIRSAAPFHLSEKDQSFMKRRSANYVILFSVFAKKYKALTHTVRRLKKHH